MRKLYGHIIPFSFRKIFLTVSLLLFLSVSFSYSQVKYKIPCKEVLLELSDTILKQQVGIREKTGHNDGRKVEAYLASVNLKKGNPYCAAGQYWCFDTAAFILNLSEKDIPLAKTGLANGMYNSAKKKGELSVYIPEVNDLIVWKDRWSSSGHIERIIAVLENGWVLTVGFNTSNGLKGSQANGNGVFYRKRNLYYPLTRLLIVRGLIGFIRIC
ncbi:MAG: hypothetical protein M1419_01220 [Bacteroidetes bacterium]|nr:hypothetical protein [Bacteroidota bacterium]